MLAQVRSLDPLAVVGGRCFTGLRDVTDDLAALDGRGVWVVTVTFEGAVTCARFDSVGAIPDAGAWVGPSLASWTSSLDRDGFCKGVVDIREAIAAGDVYEVNLCRVLSAPAPPAADVLALGSALAGGNPAPHAAVVRLPAQGIHLASASPERGSRRRTAPRT